MDENINTENLALPLGLTQEGKEDGKHKKTFSVMFARAIEVFTGSENDESELIQGRPSMFTCNREVDGISRIEPVKGDEDDDDEQEIKVLMSFPLNIDGTLYQVKITSTNNTDMVATFASELHTVVRQLSSATWRNPTLKPNQTKEEWYMENIAKVLKSGKGHGVIPKQPPRRLPPKQPNEEQVSHSSLTSTSSLNAARLGSECSNCAKNSRDLLDLKSEYEKCKEELGVASKEFQQRTEEWKARIRDMENNLESSRKEWSSLLNERDAEVRTLKEERAKILHEKMLEMENAEKECASLREQLNQVNIRYKVSQEQFESISKDLSLNSTTVKRARIEEEIWTEAEKTLALSRADVEQARKDRDAAESRARAREDEANAFIKRSEEILQSAQARIAQLEQELMQYRK